MANIFFDFDGTLIDPKVKLYNLFVDLLSRDNPIPFDQYWDLKKSKKSNEWILQQFFNLDNKEIELFKLQWMGKVESPEYLIFDKKFTFTDNILDSLKNHQLFIVTGRQFSKPVIEEIEKFKITNYFKRILITNQAHSKSGLIRNANIKFTKEDVFIGDTEEDICAAKELGMISAAVLSGVRDEKSLVTYKPDYISSDIDTLFKKNLAHLL